MSGSQAAGGTTTPVRGPGGAETRARGWSVVIIGLGLACVVVLFFAWNTQCLPVGGRPVCLAAFGVVSGWAGFGVAGGLAAGCLVLWEALSVAGALVLAGEGDERLVAACMALAALVLVLLRVLTHDSGLNWPAWLGVALAACLCGVAVARLLGDAPGGRGRGGS
ncbi:MAG TPA: hypothetical protein VLX31_07335 [Streptosporangiaceae bacterium]|nr:hypothetical protein [Streptosporangiaceae bacterium]